MPLPACALWGKKWGKVPHRSQPIDLAKAAPDRAPRISAAQRIRAHNPKVTELSSSDASRQSQDEGCPNPRMAVRACPPQRKTPAVRGRANAE